MIIPISFPKIRPALLENIFDEWNRFVVKQPFLVALYDLLTYLVDIFGIFELKRILDSAVYVEM